MVLTSISATAKQRVLMQNVSLTSQYILSIMNELVPLYETAVRLSQGVSLLRIDTDLEDTSVCCKCSQHSKCMITVRQLIQLNAKQKELKELMSSDKLSMLPELHSRIAVLRNLMYVDSQDLVTLKGRCCCLVGELEKVHSRFAQVMHYCSLKCYLRIY